MDDRLAQPNPGRHPAGTGFTLIEAVWSLLILTIMALGLIALAGQAIRSHRRILDARIATVRTWNHAADFHAGLADGEDFAPIPGRRPMRRLVLTDSQGRRWEVLRAGK